MWELFRFMEGDTKKEDWEEKFGKSEENAIHEE